ncbi:carboxymuconolactone decarboxylase family protein [Actinomadura chokoriensis]|uniref:Carboxymuconolactone decarboxylase family protein n=1 Tax=Actinomadura chokoriensis TaxID=454156 RepID=A0ABV4QSR7_9ACTN
MHLPPLPEDEWTEETRAALAVLLPERRLNPRGAGDALATLARHPDLTRAFLTFGRHVMLDSTLPPRLRELAVLRVARRRGCAYEWGHHVKIAARLGLTEAEIEGAGRGEAAGALEKAVLVAVDELDVGSELSEGTWALLGEHLDERQRLDLIFTVGAYCLMAMAFNTFGVEPESER